MKKEKKSKQIIVKLDDLSYEKIFNQAKTEHRCISEFVRHTTICYIENLSKTKST
jgi:hypothetical protein